MKANGEAYDGLAGMVVYMCGQAGIREELEQIVRENGGFDTPDDRQVSILKNVVANVNRKYARGAE